MGLRARLVLIACIGLFALAARPALAQDDAAKYPARPIHIIVGFALAAAMTSSRASSGRNCRKISASP